MKKKRKEHKEKEKACKAQTMAFLHNENDDTEGEDNLKVDNKPTINEDGEDSTATMMTVADGKSSASHDATTMTMHSASTDDARSTRIPRKQKNKREDKDRKEEKKQKKKKDYNRNLLPTARSCRKVNTRH